ncbi:MAG TPA: hypothetical protein VGA22_08150 [Gemmatimonadales bacterium]|jgi:hypothetical protein
MPVLELTAEQAEVLAYALDSYLSDLRMEIADTDAKDFRDNLKHRKALLAEVLSAIQAPHR